MSMNMFLKRFSRELLGSGTGCFKSRPLVYPANISMENRRSYADIFEPAYLDESKSTIPVHDLINIQFKGHDFPVLERYGKFVHRSAERFGLQVEDCWPTPCQKFKITRLQPESTIVAAEYQLPTYERNVQLSEVPSYLLPLLVNFIEAGLPAGVTISVHPHEPEHEKIRYIPDFQLIDLQEELGQLQAEKEKK